MPSTTNFGWTTPADTDLVKDGAAAIRTLGNGIDTSFVDLKGGTTGQVLSKNSNTDLDFTWVTSDDANAIQNAIVDAKGDLITATAADTPARLAVGANKSILVADSSTSTGLLWDDGSWTAWTPTVTAQSGTFTSVSASGSYYQLGKTVFYTASVTITTAGTAAGFIKITLPSTPAASYIGSAMNTNITGKSGAAQIASGDAAVYCADASNVTLIGTGAIIVASGFYRI